MCRIVVNTQEGGGVTKFLPAKRAFSSSFTGKTRALWYNENGCMHMHTLKGGISLSSGPIWGPLILQVVLIFMNAFFAMTEIAIISMNDA